MWVIVFLNLSWTSNSARFVFCSLGLLSSFATHLVYKLSLISVNNISTGIIVLHMWVLITAVVVHFCFKVLDLLVVRNTYHSIFCLYFTPYVSMTYFLSLDLFFSVLDSSFVFFNYLRVWFNKIYIPVAKTCYNSTGFVNLLPIRCKLLIQILFIALVEDLFQDQSGVMFGIMVLVALRLCRNHGATMILSLCKTTVAHCGLGKASDAKDSLICYYEVYFPCRFEYLLYW